MRLNLNFLKKTNIFRYLCQKVIISLYAFAGKTSDSDLKSRVKAIHELKEKLKAVSDTVKGLKMSLHDVQNRLRTEKEEAGSKATAAKGSTEMAWLIEVSSARNQYLKLRSF